MAEEMGSKEILLSEALAHLEAAIALLDRAVAPGHIAAHIDLAVNQLEELLPEARRTGGRRLDASDDGFGTIDPF